MLIHKEKLTGTASGGTLTLTTTRFAGVNLKHFLLVPATDSTTYNVSIVDRDNDTLFTESSFQGRLDRLIEIPTRDRLEIRITASSVNELYTAILRLEE